MEYIIYSDEHFKHKKVSKKFFETVSKYCTTDDTKFKNEFDEEIYNWDTALKTYIKQQFESNEYITFYYWLADGRPMGFIRKGYY